MKAHFHATAAHAELTSNTPQVLYTKLMEQFRIAFQGLKHTVHIWKYIFLPAVSISILMNIHPQSCLRSDIQPSNFY